MAGRYFLRTCKTIFNPPICPVDELAYSPQIWKPHFKVDESKFVSLTCTTKQGPRGGRAEDMDAPLLADDENEEWKEMNLLSDDDDEVYVLSSKEGKV